MVTAPQIDLAAASQALGVPLDPTWDQARLEQAISDRIVGSLHLNVYMGGHFPTVPQMAFLLLPQKEILYGGATKGGKALTLDTLLPTFDGWTTMGAVQVGDWLFDDQGRPCQVTAISSVMYDHTIYAVTFDDGQTIKADADHKWLTFTANERARLGRQGEEWRAKRRATRPSRSLGKRPDLAEANTERVYQYAPPPQGVVRTTQEIKDTLFFRGTDRINHTVPVCQPLNVPDMKLSIDPYILGVWLGDGTSAGGSITIGDQDLEMIDHLNAAGLTLIKGKTKYLYGTHGLAVRLREIGVLNNKHIPLTYLRASLSQRLALLQGLMDTDGTADKRGQCEFCVVNEALARSVHELIQSLGIAVSFHASDAVLNGKVCGTRYRMKFVSTLPMFRLKRKLERQSLDDLLRRKHRSIVSVTPIPTEPVKCLTVDSPSHLFLAGRNFVPTHNSDAILMAALQYIDVPGYNALILHRTFTDLNKGDALIPRFREWTDGKGVKWDDENHTGVFPSGAKVAFGFVDTEGAGRRYKGANYQFIGWEELTEQPTDTDYVYLFSRLSRPNADPAKPPTDPQNRLAAVPLRVRSTTNPDGPGQPWVKVRFGLGHDDAGVKLVNPRPDRRLFIPARLRDNPHIDQAAVTEALSELDEVKRAQLEDGNWDVASTGDLFMPDRIRIVPLPTEGVIARYRGWDKAGTDAQAKHAKRAKFTVGLCMARVDKRIYGVEYVITDLVRGQWAAGERNLRIRAQAFGGVVKTDRILADPPGTVVWVEQEPGSGGKESAEITVSDLAGVEVHTYLPTGEKADRARPWAAQMEHYNVGMVQAPWNAHLCNVLRAAPKGVYWDEIDAGSMVFNKLALLVSVPLPLAQAYPALPSGMRTD